MLGQTRECLRARGTRRANVVRRLALQNQVVEAADAAAKSACARRPLTVFPYM